MTFGGGVKADARHVEQDARTRAPAAEHAEPAVVLGLRRRRDDALGDLALEHQREALEEGGHGSASSQPVSSTVAML